MLPLLTRLFRLYLLFGTFVSTKGMTKEECEAQYLPELLQCLDDPDRGSLEMCEAMPVLDVAFTDPSTVVDGQAFWMKQLRDSASTQVYAVGAESYIHLIVVDTPTAPRSRHVGGGVRGLKKGRLIEKSWRGKKGSKKKGYNYYKSSASNYKMKRTMVTGPRVSPMRRMKSKPRNSDELPRNDDPGSTKDATVAFLDLPVQHIQRNPPVTGNIVGTHALSALEIIMTKVLGRPMSDIAKFEIIYSHPHSDHVGATNATYSILTQTWGYSSDDISIIAPEATAEYIDELETEGKSTFRVMKPTVTYTGETRHVIGSRTSLVMSPLDVAHGHPGTDVIVFLDRDSDQPPIMMMVDIL